MNNRRWAFSILSAGLILGAIVLWFFMARRQPEQVKAQLVGIPVVQAAGYEQVTGPRQLVFPRDFGPHPDFQTEWWYYTGNLSTGDGRLFGYQLTFFRRALQPPAERSQRSSQFAAEQVYMAHFTITDVAGGKFQAFERFERGAAGLAGASGDPLYQVWLHDWSVMEVGEGEYQLRAAEKGMILDLRLVDRKGIILQGDRGYSQKGPDPANASIYYSQPLLESQGTLQLGENTFNVSGYSWLDREISTSALSQGQVGWNWFALQLADGSEVMAYVLRRSDGSVDAFSNGTYIAPDGTTTLLNRDDFQVQSAGSWRSPHSGGNYPNQWSITIPSKRLVLRVKPLLADQELNLSFTYWEGAVEINGERDGEELHGFGYVELTGYARSLEGGL